ncbi:hypothetical protein EG327_004959 [Venturia inaequalis]|uniref:Uncharacterized protein n=1 Tax=Venturia inaequalis TaxID=5025 RepID=A0A8H3ZBJ5_VENIN|nr:hypothetical protein EG327_004959 [Venturia inaequalis]
MKYGHTIVTTPSIARHMVLVMVANHAFVMEEVRRTNIIFHEYKGPKLSSPRISIEDWALYNTRTWKISLNDPHGEYHPKGTTWRTKKLRASQPSYIQALREYSRITIFQALIGHTQTRCAAHGGFDIDQLLFSAFPYTLDQIVGAIEVKTTQIEDGGQDVDAERRDCLKVGQ